MSLHSIINFRRAVFCCEVAVLKKKKITKCNNITTTTTNNTLTRLPSAELIDLEQTACGQSVEGANFR